MANQTDSSQKMYNPFQSGGATWYQPTASWNENDSQGTDGWASGMKNVPVQWQKYVPDEAEAAEPAGAVDPNTYTNQLQEGSFIDSALVQNILAQIAKTQGNVTSATTPTTATTEQATSTPSWYNPWYLYQGNKGESAKTNGAAPMYPNNTYK